MERRDHPVEMITGKDCINQKAQRMKALGSRCLIVTGKTSAEKSGVLVDLRFALNGQEIAWHIFDGITPNPTVEECRLAGLEAARHGANFIIGIGGGSAMDAAKAVAVFAANPTLNEEALYAKSWSASPLPIVLVGTTAGTGSEVTKVSVLTDHLGRKHSIHDDKLYASLAYGDPTYTQSVPARTRLSTGIDILMHCLESFFSKKADDISQKEAIAGISLACQPLLRFAKKEVLGEEELFHLYEASLHGGYAIDRTGTCFPHCLGYWLTENASLPHGFACAAFLPELLSHAKSTAPELCAQLEEKSGVSFSQLLELHQLAMPAISWKVTSAALESALPRWDQHKSVLNTIGSVSLSDVRSYLEKYVKES